MCHSTDFNRRYSDRNRDRDRLKIKSFFVKFSGFGFRPIPELLTLLYLPRIDETELEVDGAKIRPDSPAFLTLHRAVAETAEGDVVFGSRERVKASEGVRFVVFVGDEKALKGIFRRDSDEEWRLECKCELQTLGAGAAVADVAMAEVCVGVDVGGGRGEHVALCERVKIAVGEKRKRKRRERRFHGLEEIPEERTVDCESDGQCCCSCSSCDGDDVGSSDGGGEKEKCECDGDLEMEIQGVRWAFDLGIWVMCLGVGFLASKASAKALRRLRIL